MSTTKPAPVPRAACTLKQARADYKARGGPVVSEAEQRQIDRGAELDRRAFKARESDKRRAEADKKKLESERQSKIRARELLGSQRMTDRFGYKSSQFHLGAFFAAGPQARAVPQGNARVDEGEDEKEDEDEDVFGDEGLDDQSLLDALDVPAAAIGERDEHARDHILEANNEVEVLDDFSLAWEDLDSSTQLARDLAVIQKPPSPLAEDQHFHSSFEASSFDISIEDLEALERSTTAQRSSTISTTAEKDCRMMLPPQIPKYSKLPDTHTTGSRRRDSRLCSTPYISTDVAASRMSKSLAKSTVDAPGVAGMCGFSMAELESFVDDDLQLTQLAPT